MGDGVRYRPGDELYEARLLVPREMRATLGKTYLSFYAKRKSDAKRNKALADLLSEGPQSLNSEKITFGAWLSRWLDGPAKSKGQGTREFYEVNACRSV